ncbi:MAG: HU family DNA-binding protein [Deltaproteobacteria bacterium]|nr:MAG: HU family DNA-binding protein [Deltaproteobacteria bacterium]
MNWTELLREVSERTSMSAKDTRAVIEAMVETILEELVEGNQVNVRGLGTFSTRTVSGRTMRSVRSRRKMWVGAHDVPRFKSAKRLRAAVASRSEKEWKDPAHQAAWRLAETLVGDLELYHSGETPQLPANVQTQQVHEICADAFGEPWRSAEQRYQQRSGDTTVDYLALAAQRRWGS